MEGAKEAGGAADVKTDKPLSCERPARCVQLKMSFFIGNHSNGNSGKIYMSVVYGNILIVEHKAFDYVLRKTEAGTQNKCR